MQFKPRKQHIYSALNKKGRDFIVGDLHGQVDLLFTQLVELGFNFKFDRLFCTGDLIGRGKSSVDCLNLLTRKWFYSVMGNHEQLFLLGFKSSKYWDILKSENGAWLSDNLDRFDLLVRWKTLIDIAMPLTRTIRVEKGHVGISHASSVADWSTLQIGHLTEKDIWTLLWSRPSLNRHTCPAITSIDCVVHGHTPVNTVVNINNRFWIDTYSSSNQLTILNLDELDFNSFL